MDPLGDRLPQQDPCLSFDPPVGDWGFQRPQVHQSDSRGWKTLGGSWEVVLGEGGYQGPVLKPVEVGGGDTRLVGTGLKVENLVGTLGPFRLVSQGKWTVITNRDTTRTLSSIG